MTTTDTTDAARWDVGLELIVAAWANAVHVTLRDGAGWEGRAFVALDPPATVPLTVTETWVHTQVNEVVRDVLATLGMAMLYAHEGRSSLSSLRAAITAQTAAYVHAVWVPVEQVLRDGLATHGVHVEENDPA
jgi:hypothetical protein